MAKLETAFSCFVMSTSDSCRVEKLKENMVTLEALSIGGRWVNMYPCGTEDICREEEY